MKYFAIQIGTTLHEKSTLVCFCNLSDTNVAFYKFFKHAKDAPKEYIPCDNSPE